MEDLNKTTGKDIAYAAAKATMGSIPVVGAAASEILGLIVTPPLEKRRNSLLLEIGQRLIKLEGENRIDVTGLKENQQFIDTVLQATTYALKTSEQEKISAFQNAIINTAICETPDKTVCQIFLNLIDTYTVWHIKILHLFNDPVGWFKSNQRDFPSYHLGGLNSIIEDAFPELKGKRELMNIIWGDLKRVGLHNSGDLGGMMTGHGLQAPRTTEMGKEFLRYIQNKDK